MKRLTVLFAVLFLVTLTSWVGWAYWQGGQLRTAQLEARNARAAAATTEREKVQLAGTWYAVHSKLVLELKVQLEVAQQQLVDARKGRAIADAQLTVLGGQLKVARQGPVVTVPSPDPALQTSALTVSDTVDGRDSIGVWVAVTAVIPPARDSASWKWDIRRDSLSLNITLSCEADNARAIVRGPTWAQISLDRVQQDDGICLERRVWRPFTIEAPSLPVAGALVAAGIVVRSLFGGQKP